MTIRLYNTLTRNKEDLATGDAGQGRHLPVRPDRLRQGPHRPHGRAGDLRHDQAVPGLQRLRSDLGRQHHRRRRQTDQQGQRARAVDGRRWPARTPRDYLANLAGLGVDQIDHMPKATENIDEIIRFIQGLIDQDFAYVVGRRRVLRRRQGPGLRQAEQPQCGQPAGRRRRSGGQEAFVRRFCLVESRQAGRARRGTAPGARAVPAGTSSARP